MENNQIDNDLPYIAIIYSIVAFFILYFNVIYIEHKNEIEFEKAYSRIQHLEDRVYTLEEDIQSMNSYADYLENRISLIGKLEIILKDLERSYIRK